MNELPRLIILCVIGTAGWEVDGLQVHFYYFPVVPQSFNCVHEPKSTRGTTTKGAGAASFHGPFDKLPFEKWTLVGFN